MKLLQVLAVTFLLFLSACVSMNKPREVMLPATQQQIRDEILGAARQHLKGPEVLVDTAGVLHLRWRTELSGMKQMAEARYEFRTVGASTAVSLGSLQRTETFGDDGKWHARDVSSEQPVPFAPSLDDLKARFAK